jgi:hypothetical protein
MFYYVLLKLVIEHLMRLLYKYYVHIIQVTRFKPRTSKTGFGQVEIMKEFVLININFFLNLAFGQVGGGKN